MKTEPVELYRKHRPKLFKHVIGQDDAVRVLTRHLEKNTLPHVLLLTGPSGCGKTTIARICKEKLECADMDFAEINAADTRGIDTVRDIRTKMHLSPAVGKCRIFYIDECHKLSNDAQNALLKMLEDTPSHSYFILATTEPNKLIRTIITRSTEIRLKELNTAALQTLLKSVAEKEKFKLTEDVMDKIIECAMGSARMALVLLNKIIGITDESEQIDAIEKNTHQKEAIELARALLRGADWSEVADLIKKIDDEAESVRWLILGYMSSVSLSNGKIAGRALQVMEAFQYDYYSTKKAGLIMSCAAVTR